MTAAILNTYFEQHQRDVLVLEVRDNHPAIDRQLLWFKQRGIDLTPVAVDVVTGYLVDINPDSAILWDYTFTFEDASGLSRLPDSYQMIRLDYKQWLCIQEISQKVSEVGKLLNELNRELKRKIKYPGYPREQLKKKPHQIKRMPRLTRKRQFAIIRV